ncbi:fasciclin domain-containing protein [Nocardioides sp. URHA0020]|uniref:fasciclin domain-containing protein n=1 Tax=Nocardioides sp. URHA0020 TaxID=1380392 RepID=UPI0018CC2122|nr:fasciclin domain-containing protein [Nocardioides sp. URHA0020]
MANTAAPASASLGDRSLAAVLAADGHHFDHNWGDFDIVDEAVTTVLKAKPDSPVGVLAKGNVRLTAFLPTDAAFRRLVTSVTGKKPASESATFKKVAGLVDVDTLEAILLYHVVPGARINAAQASKADGAKLKTAAGLNLRVNVKRSGAIKLLDKDKDAWNATVIPSKVNINKGNTQIAHGISRVLRPADL